MDNSACKPVWSIAFVSKKDRNWSRCRLPLVLVRSSRYSLVSTARHRDIPRHLDCPCWQVRDGGNIWKFHTSFILCGWNMSLKWHRCDTSVLSPQVSLWTWLLFCVLFPFVGGDHHGHWSPTVELLTRRLELEPKDASKLGAGDLQVRQVCTLPCSFAMELTFVLCFVSVCRWRPPRPLEPDIGVAATMMADRGCKLSHILE